MLASVKMVEITALAVTSDMFRIWGDAGYERQIPHNRRVTGHIKSDRPIKRGARINLGSHKTRIKFGLRGRAVVVDAYPEPEKSEIQTRCSNGRTWMVQHNPLYGLDYGADFEIPQDSLVVTANG